MSFRALPVTESMGVLLLFSIENVRPPTNAVPYIVRRKMSIRLEILNQSNIPRTETPMCHVMFCLGSGAPVFTG